jgi:hypothetical protein
MIAILRRICFLCHRCNFNLIFRNNGNQNQLDFYPIQVSNNNGEVNYPKLEKINYVGNNKQNSNNDPLADLFG